MMAQPVRAGVGIVYGPRRASRPDRSRAVAKGQQKKSKEARKPKAEKPPKQNASNPSTKGDAVKMVNIKG